MQSKVLMYLFNFNLKIEYVKVNVIITKLAVVAATRKNILVSSFKSRSLLFEEELWLVEVFIFSSNG